MKMKKKNINEMNLLLHTYTFALYVNKLNRSNGICRSKRKFSGKKENEIFSYKINTQ